MQQQIIRETFLLVSKRDENVCNFLEGGRSVAPPFAICSFIGLLNLGGPIQVRYINEERESL